MGTHESKELRRKLSNLTITNVTAMPERLGEGTIGETVIVKYNGLRCSSKRLYPSHIRTLPRSSTDLEDELVGKCRQLSELKHPNIIQFLGIWFPHSEIPSLVMELLPGSLPTFLNEYENAPKFYKYSILYDIILGLYYLHLQSPPIIHQDLTVDNILITHGLKAKIVLQIIPYGDGFSENGRSVLQLDSDHIPPEALHDEDAIFSEKFDVFSYGHMILHIVFQKPPILRREPGYTEVDCRSDLLAEMDSESPFHEVAMLCLQDDPDHRPETKAVCDWVEDAYVKTPPLYPTTVDMLHALNIKQGIIRDLSEKLADKKAMRGGVSQTLAVMEEQFEQALVRHEIELENKNAEIAELCEAAGVVAPSRNLRRRDLQPAHVRIEQAHCMKRLAKAAKEEYLTKLKKPVEPASGPHRCIWRRSTTRENSARPQEYSRSPSSDVEPGVTFNAPFTLVPAPKRTVAQIKMGIAENTTKFEVSSGDNHRTGTGTLPQSAFESTEPQEHGRDVSDMYRRACRKPVPYPRK